MYGGDEVAFGADIIVQPHHKGFPATSVGRPINELGGSALTDGGFSTPVLLLRSDALDHNITAMQSFCDAAGMSLAPHVKTTMSPEIIAAQLEHGAWAVTVATPTQARTVRQLGVDRILLANELVDPAAIEWFGAELDEDPEFVGCCYVDSCDSVTLLDEVLATRRQRRPLPVLVELGMVGGRTGARTVPDAVAVAEAAAGSRHLRVAGVGGFEGIIDIGLRPERLDEVEQYLCELRRAADATLAGIAQPADEFVVTVGGSAFFELVRDVFDVPWRGGRAIRVVLRSGCYVTHDSLGYQAYRTVMRHRCEPLALTPALELWARVLSRPEPDLALLDFGKRDVGIDAGYPVPQYVVRRDSTTCEPAQDAAVVALNDQHAYLKASSPAQPLTVEPGDLVGFGISHPCTTIDKWRLIPLVDDDRRLLGAVRTMF